MFLFIYWLDAGTSYVSANGSCVWPSLGNMDTGTVVLYHTQDSNVAVSFSYMCNNFHSVDTQMIQQDVCPD